MRRAGGGCPRFSRRQWLILLYIYIQYIYRIYILQNFKAAVGWYERPHIPIYIYIYIYTRVFMVFTHTHKHTHTHAHHRPRISRVLVYE
jgi:hypothetical protein